MKKLSLTLTIVVIIFLGCYLPENENEKGIDFPSLESLDIFNLDSISNIINNSYHEVGLLPNDSEESQYCKWLKKYKELVNNKIANSPNYDNRLYQIVGYVKFSEDKYFVEYEGCCEEANQKEIPARAKKQINWTSGCPIPKDNKFEPKSFSNSISKTHPYSKGALSLIQVWFNKK